MRGDIIKLLHYEATVKPDVKQLLDRVDSMTDDDINNAVVPLPWYRDALRKIKAQNAYATMQALVNAHAIDGQTNDPMGWMAKWDADETTMAVDKGGVDVKFNTAVWFPDTGGVWIETLFSNFIDPKLNALRKTQHIKRSEYLVEYRKRLQALSPTSTINLTGGAADKPRFTIQRH
jgi:hypothetical protein